jgi:catechol-2,3-dioxygenase
MHNPPPITAVAEIVLSVRDLPGMRKFYRDVLGFRPLAEATHDTASAAKSGKVAVNEERPAPVAADGATNESETPTICFLTIAPNDTPLGRNGHPQLLVLVDYRRHANARGRFDGHDVRRSTLNHLAFEIPLVSYDDHRRRLEGLGLDPQPTTFAWMRARALFFKDPEGNTLELICHDPAVTDEQAR